MKETNGQIGGGEPDSAPFSVRASEIRALVLIKPNQILAKEAIEKCASQFFRKASVVCPESLESLNQTSAKAHKSFDLVVVGGGDGTLNRVIQNIDFGEIGVAVAALGSGNDFARNFKSGRNIFAKFAAFDSAVWQKVDLIRAGTFLFHNSGGVGLDAATLVTRERAISKLGRDYNVAFLRTLSRLRPFAAEITISGEKFAGEYLWALAMNNRWIGGGMSAAPNAKIDDGLLDALLVVNISKLKLAGLFPQIYSGTHIRNPAVSYRQSVDMSISFKYAPEHIALDGEIYPWKERYLEFKVLPNSMWVFGEKIT